MSAPHYNIYSWYIYVGSTQLLSFLTEDKELKTSCVKLSKCKRNTEAPGLSVEGSGFKPSERHAFDHAPSSLLRIFLYR